MKKMRWVTLSSLFYPWMVIADGVNFAPPTGDYSVTFLSNIFGVVDGVLSGTGSQIVGAMFSVFNAAVLAIGGIIIMYTLVVATMNTAHEGKFLGQKWSSIWVPVRVAVGLALLLPKASGYCMMQIFFMWAIVQGVGAADKVWDGALQYLNRGGVIIAEQLNPSSAQNAANTANINKGALTMLAGQVCMLGLQNVLQAAQTSFQSTANTSGPCAGTAPNSYVSAICTSVVPDFLTSVNFVEAQALQAPDYAQSLCQTSSSTTPSVPANFFIPMPNFPTSSAYVSLNGICGGISWNPISTTDIQNIQNSMSGTTQTSQSPIKIPGQQDTSTSQSSTSSLTCGDLQATVFSRAIALQQMYIDLQAIATTMINNDPQIATLNSTSTTTTTGTTYSSIATNQFGVAFQSNGQVCTTQTGAGTNSSCVAWGPDPSTQVAVPVIFSGTEFNQAVLDYDGVMSPTLNLINNANNMSNYNSARSFISNAEQQGWLMAGAYFFNLVVLNGNAATSNQQVDSSSGLENSITPCASFQASAFGEDNGCDPSTACGSGSGTSATAATYPALCYMLNMQSTNAMYVNALINGLNFLSTPVSFPNFSGGQLSVIQGAGSSTVYGFGTNESMVTVPGQPGTTAPVFQFNFKPSMDPSSMSLPKMHFPAGPLGIGRLLGDIFYNTIIKVLLQFVINLLMQLVGIIVQMLLVVPMITCANIIIAAMAILTQNGVNPIVCLGNMGTSLVNYVLDFIPVVAVVSYYCALYPPVAIVVAAVAPLTVSLVMSFFIIGMLTAYYIPFVPYMAFLFGSIAWFIAVIEAMVAAPLVALGVVYPEGHEVMGKAEPGFMILLNVFLRPSMMIVGFILGISLSYVAVWVLNAGFQNAQSFFNGGQGIQYQNFAGMLTIFYSTTIYTMLYLTIVQKAFSLIYILPDGILRWIGGQPEHVGGEAAGWGQEVKQKVGEMGESTAGAVGDNSGASQLGSEEKEGRAHAEREASKDKKPSSGQGSGAQAKT